MMRFVMRLFFTLAFSLTLIPLGPAAAEDALAAVAANFAGAAEELAAAFNDKTGHEVTITTGSTGKLYAQVTNGAPFDLFLSADAATPEKLEAAGFAVKGTRFTYAQGSLALWSAEAGRIGADGKAALEAGDVRHIAIANPALAPYGQAAQETLSALGLWDALQGKIVMGQNVGQTYSLIDTGNAQLGFVALSAVLKPGSAHEGSYWTVPPALYQPIRQDAVLLPAGETNEAARGFLDYLQSAEARKLIAAYGYGFDG
ncbi:molybdate ABC transporter substrate-binding protein [Tepidicaulis sp. LMO-SS28]|uniref:molybdate ABC transporter substrate-binding protein n=1 Tax=Tepidicaulis sp. LMO-SS28 TaxID=3447455 RepID=UPI003EDF7CB3